MCVCVCVRACMRARARKCVCVFGHCKAEVTEQMNTRRMMHYYYTSDTLGLRVWYQTVVMFSQAIIVIAFVPPKAVD